jgi:DNA-binding CsgD family transcriptional regulator
VNVTSEGAVFLAERDAHLRQFDRLLSGAAEGKGGVLLLDGPIASGKTELLRVFAERAGSSGFACLDASGDRAEQELPLGVTGQLLQSTVLPRETRRHTARRLGDLRAGVAEREMIAAIDAACSALIDFAADAPLLICIDDFRHADPASVRFLRHLVRRLRAVPVLLVLTDDGELASRDSSLHAELRRQPHLHRLRLAPLSKDGVTRMLTEQLCEADAHQLAPEFFAASGGNPLLLRALIDDHHDFPAGETPGYGPALLSCLHCADPFVIRVARSLAVLDEDASPETVRQLLDAGPGEVERAIDALNAAGLLDEGAFRHPAGPAAMLDDLPDENKADLHHRAAELLHERDAPAATIAAHLIDAGYAQAPWGVRALVTTAEEALVSDEVEAAVTALALAHSSCADEQERAVIRARLAQAEWQLDPAVAARHLAPLTVAMRADRLDRRDGIMLVRQLLWHGQVAEATDVLDRIRSAGSDGEVAAELRATELWLTSSHPSLARIGPAAPAPKHQAEPGMDPTLRSTAVLADVLTRGESRDAVERALEVLRNVGVNHGRSWADESAMFALLVLISASRSDIAAKWCDRLRGEAAARRSPRRRALFTAARSVIAARQGDLPEAARLARTAMTDLPPKSWGAAIGFPLGGLLLATTRLGRYQEAAKLLTRPVPAAMFDSRYGLPYLYARGGYHLATGDHHAALADFLSCGKLVRRWSLDGAGLVPWRAGAAEAWLGLGEHDQARRLLYDELARPGVEESASRGAALRLLAATAPLQRRLRLLSEALGNLEAAADRFEQARTLTDLGRAQHALGDTRRARTSLRRAWSLSKMCEAAPLCEDLLAIDSDLGESADAPPGVASLTESERRVASLAALGYTNREIAGRLRVTASTVEQHLTRVYRKLDVKRRDDLPVELRRQAASPV